MRRKHTHLKVNEFGEIGICDEHLVKTRADQTLHFPEVTQQLGIFLKTKTEKLWLSSLIRLDLCVFFRTKRTQ